MLFRESDRLPCDPSLKCAVDFTLPRLLRELWYSSVPSAHQEVFVTVSLLAVGKLCYFPSAKRAPSPDRLKTQ